MRRAEKLGLKLEVFRKEHPLYKKHLRYMYHQLSVRAGFLLPNELLSELREYKLPEAVRGIMVRAVQSGRAGLDAEYLNKLISLEPTKIEIASVLSEGWKQIEEVFDKGGTIFGEGGDKIRIGHEPEWFDVEMKSDFSGEPLVDVRATELRQKYRIEILKEGIAHGLRVYIVARDSRKSLVYCDGRACLSVDGKPPFKRLDLSLQGPFAARFEREFKSRYLPSIIPPSTAVRAQMARLTIEPPGLGIYRG